MAERKGKYSDDHVSYSNDYVFTEEEERYTLYQKKILCQFSDNKLTSIDHTH